MSQAINHFPQWGIGNPVDYDRDAAVTDHIRKCALTFPKKIALIDASAELTYEKLLRQSTQLAKKLALLDIQCGDRIALLMKPSANLIILMLAILLRQACYVPIDFHYPEKRIQRLLSDCQPRALIVEASLANTIGVIDTAVFTLDDLFLSVADAPEGNPIVCNTMGEKPAYIIYTSGSTGTPKGVLIPHRAINNHMLWMAKEFNLTHKDRFLLKTPFTFDPSVWEIFLPLMLGATLIIAKSGTHSRPDLINNYVEQHQISVLQLVPAILHNMLSDNRLPSLSSLHYLFVGGDTLSTKTKTLFFEKYTKAHLINLYGPTETTIDTTFHRVSPTEDDRNYNYIGKPIDNTQLYVINDQGKEAAIGEIGELVITGDSVGLGYLHRSTHRNFEYANNKNTACRYWTGDWVRWSKKGVLEYLGRQDHQIKINGVRLNTLELTQVIQLQENVYDYKLDVVEQAVHGFSQLYCYLIPEKGKAINLKALKKELEKQFPTYMLPHQYIVVKEDCLSTNGKISLQKIKSSIPNNTEHPIASTSEDIKRTLLSIWRSILNFPVTSDKINFFDLGGDSISAYVLLSEINTAFKINISFNHLIENPTLTQQAHYIRSLKQSAFPRLKRNDSPIMTLNSPASKHCFLIHPIGGTIFWYLPLAKQLDHIVQLHAIADPGLTASAPLFSSIEEMARHYTQYILSEFEIDNYILGGASFGGTVAVEIARSLTASGKQVESLQIFDGWAIYPKALQDKKYFYNAMLQQQNAWKNQLKKRQRSLSDINALFPLQMQRLNLLFQYKMTPFNVPVNLYKAEITLPIFQPIDEPSNHWGQYTAHCSVQVVPGDHETMFVDAHAQCLAEKLSHAVCGQQPVT